MLCANSKLSGCNEILRGKGNIFCESCTDSKKNLSKLKREQDIDELFKKIADTEKENMRLRQSIFEIKLSYDKEIKSLIETIEKKSNDQEQKIKELEKLNTTLEKLNKDYEDLNAKEKLEISMLQKDLIKCKEQNIEILNEKDKINMNFDQLKIDYDKLKLENNKYNEEQPSSRRNTTSKLVNIKL